MTCPCTFDAKDPLRHAEHKHGTLTFHPNSCRRARYQNYVASVAESSFDGRIPEMGFNKAGMRITKRHHILTIVLLATVFMELMYDLERS